MSLIPNSPSPGKHNSIGTDSADPFYVPSDIKRPKRFRRTKAVIGGIRDAITDILENDHPQTVRQVFYALTVRGVIAKAEIEYHRTVVRLLVEMREAGQVPFEWIADNTRWMRKPTAYLNRQLVPSRLVGRDARVRGGVV
jgi:hypothetical protein